MSSASEKVEMSFLIRVTGQRARDRILLGIYRPHRNKSSVKKKRLKTHIRFNALSICWILNEAIRRGILMTLSYGPCL
jgi:hypothetical protein